MAKLTKAQAKAHAQAIDLLTKPKLTEDDKEFVFRNWNEGATHNNGDAGAFFTPYDMAFDFAFDVGGPRIIDLCAGIGMLSYAVYSRHKFGHRDSAPQITCIERNPDYVEIGRKLLPEATWICADVFDVIGMGLHTGPAGLFEYAISNPPFGKVRRTTNAPRYSGADFEFHVIDIAAHIARAGTFIVPQGSAGFNYSGRQSHERQTEGKAFKFQEMAGVYFSAGCGVDTALYQQEWKGVSPLCEIVCVEFDPGNDEWPVVGDPSKRVPLVRAANDNVPVAPQQALDLFGGAA
jgi:hypothetical protein